MSITNTRLAYLYHDADNYKVRHEVVFAGQMSEEEKMRIIASLDDGEYFIPGPLGLNDERFGSETEADHPFFEFCYFEETTDKTPLATVQGHDAHYAGCCDGLQRDYRGYAMLRWSKQRKSRIFQIDKRK